MNTASIPDFINGKSILLFDGYCNLCNNTVQFVLTREKKPVLLFASLQSDFGRRVLAHFHIDPATTDSLVLIENNKAHVKSSAALRVSRYLKGLYPVGIAALIIPPFIRNAVYDYIARNRYKWYGRSDTCLMPKPEWKNRFIEI